jgi:activator of 2-hydroxyglutaryl-CoA dehydratase
MVKENSNQYHDDSNLSLKRKVSEEVLEISSTGYGLESVSKETEAEHKLQETKNRNSSCGGV